MFNGFLIATAIVVFSIPANAQPSGSIDDSERAFTAFVAPAIKSFGKIVIIHNDSSTRTQFLSRPERHISVTANVGEDFETNLNDLQFPHNHPLFDLGGPPCTNHKIEDQKSAGLFLYHWCNLENHPAGTTNQDLYMFIGGDTILIGSNDVNCSDLPSSVENGVACNDMHDK